MLRFFLRPLLHAIFVGLLFTPLLSEAQFSFGLEVGGAALAKGEPDAYSLSALWPLKSSTTSSEGDAISFYDGGSATAVSAIVTWEASSYFGLSAVYRTLNWSMSSSYRTSTMNSFGLQFKFNFVKNTKNFVPFAQAEFMAINSNNLTQQQATSKLYTQQVQPSFEKAFTTNLGAGLDVGAEFKISQPFNIVIKGGLHGVQMANSGPDKDFTRTLNYGVYLPPGGLDGVVFSQFTAGLKYYTGRAKKKRDY